MTRLGKLLELPLQGSLQHTRAQVFVTIMDPRQQSLLHEGLLGVCLPDHLLVKYHLPTETTA